MKTTYKGYFAIPNLGRLRSRIQNPPQDLSSRIREKAQSIIAETLNENTLAIRAKLADFVVNECGLTFKSKAAEQQVAAITGAIFDSFFASTATQLEALIGAAPKTGTESAEEEVDTEEGDIAKEGGDYPADTEEGDIAKEGGDYPADTESAEEGDNPDDSEFED